MTHAGYVGMIFPEIGPGEGATLGGVVTEGRDVIRIPETRWRTGRAQ